MREKDSSKDGTAGPAEEAGGFLELKLRPSTGELRGLSEQAEAFARRHRLRPKAIDAMLLALEEAVTNVLMYAFEGVPEERREVFVCLQMSREALVVTIRDNGLAFDPTHARPRAGLEDGDGRPGGWGITLIRGLIDEVHYARIGDRNQLELVVYV
jgi:serine/threonine-protein kinase RsbW